METFLPSAGTVPFGSIKASQQGQSYQASSRLVSQCLATQVSSPVAVLAPGYGAVVTACIIWGAVGPSSSVTQRQRDFN